jgi:hypothetical protein
MGIVALGTVAFDDNTVRAARLFRQHVFMTAEAKISRIGAQHFFMGRGMRFVTGGTFSGFCQRVYGATFKRFLKRLVTFQTNFPFGTGLELEFADRINPGCHHQRKYEAN